MKKICMIASSALLAVIMFCTVFCAATVVEVPNDNGAYTPNLNGKVDVLDQVPCEYRAPLYPDGTSDTNTLKLTDGIYAIEPMKELFGISYFNGRWATAENVAAVAEKPGSRVYPLTTGGESRFYYSFEWSELDVDASSFSIWCNQEAPSVFTTDSFNWWVVDPEFQILVSQDGGKTYTVAYASTPYVLSADGTAVESASALLKSEGGDWEQFDAVTADGITLFRYRQLAADFTTEYKNVTNIVYGAVSPRAGLNKAPFTPWYYGPRLSEIDVYGTTRNPITTEASTTAEVTTAEVTTAEVTTEEPKTDAPVNTEEPKTDAPVNTEAPVNTDAPANTEAPADEKKGCGSSVAVLGVAMVMTLGCAIIRKKH